MSAYDPFTIPDDILVRDDLTPSAKLMYVGLSKWPDAPVETIAETVGLSGRTAWRVVTQLEDAGLIVRGSRTRLWTVK